jgi:hypothetical protein
MTKPCPSVRFWRQTQLYADLEAMDRPLMDLMNDHINAPCEICLRHEDHCKTCLADGNTCHDCIKHKYCPYLMLLDHFLEQTYNARVQLTERHMDSNS